MQEKPIKAPPTRPTEPEREGHRERLRQHFKKGGPNAVQDHELLELILFRMHARRDVKPIVHRLLKRFKDLSGVLSAPEDDLKAFAGVGEQTLIDFRIIHAAALRFGQDKTLKGSVLAGWDDLIVYCRTKMVEEKVESFHVLFLDKKNHIIADEVMGRGTVDHTPVYPREVIKRALALDATALIIAHNHPSGDPSPSPADIEMTMKLRDLANSFGIALHDHLVVARSEVLSFKDKGLL